MGWAAGRVRVGERRRRVEERVEGGDGGWAAGDASARLRLRVSIQESVSPYESGHRRTAPATISGAARPSTDSIEGGFEGGQSEVCGFVVVGVDGWPEKEIGLFCVKSGVDGGPPRRPWGGGLVRWELEPGGRVL